MNPFFLPFKGLFQKDKREEEERGVEGGSSWEW